MTRINYPQRAEVWYINLDPTIGHEQAKKRPCLIISNNLFNKKSKLCIVAPITSTCRNNPFHIPVEPPEGGLLNTSYILTDQIRTVSHLRLSGKGLGVVSPETIQVVEARIQDLLDL